MKKCLIVLLILLNSLFSLYALESKYRIDGKSYNKQIFDDQNNQITNFKNWELITAFYVSPDNTKMLVYHRPDKSKAYLITLYDLKSKKILAECEPGFACFGVQWTDNYLIYKWGATGRGMSFEYRNYDNLKVEKTVTALISFEDFEDDILIKSSYFYFEKEIIFHKYSDGTVLKTVDCVEELRHKGIDTNAISVFGIEKTGKRKYKFSISYYLSSNGKEDEVHEMVLELKLE